MEQITNLTTYKAAHTGNGEVSCVLLINAIPQQPSACQSLLAAAAALELHYEQYGIGNISFAFADVVDRTLMDEFGNVLNYPIVVFFVGDGASCSEYYRSCGPMTLEQMKFYIERKRA